MKFKDKEKYNEYMNNYMKLRWKNRRLNAVKQLGGRCVKCGNSNFDDLEFDHINPESKEYTIAKASSFSDKRFQEELSKCQILCRDTCHLDKTKINGSLGNRQGTIVCACGKVFEGTKNYAGHSRWCKV